MINLVVVQTVVTRIANLTNAGIVRSALASATANRRIELLTHLGRLAAHVCEVSQ